MKSLVFLLILFGALPCLGQTGKAPDKKSVNTANEFISKDCGFKIQFPQKPVVEVNQFGSTIIRDFKVTVSQTEWRVSCSDDKDFVGDGTLKDKYAQSVKSLLRGNRKLIGQKDIYLNGKLGVEFIIEDLESATITRAFLIQSRLYQIVFKQNKKAADKSEIDFTPKDFFDSFSFWAEESEK